MIRRLTAVAALAAVLLTGCVVTGDPPDEAIPPALLDSDLGIVEATADTSTSGTSVSVVVTVVAERAELAADELRQLIAIAVENTHVTNPHSLRIYADSDEIDPESIAGSRVPIDLRDPARQLGLELTGGVTDGTDAIEALWPDVLAMLEQTR